MKDSSQVYINGIGLCSSLGGLDDSCAAFRAGIDRFSGHADLKTMVSGDTEPTPLTIASAATNLDGYQGFGRSVKLLQMAYQDLVGNNKGAFSTENMAILMAMPDPEDRAIEQDVDAFISRDERLQHAIDAVTVPLFKRINPCLEQLPLQCVFGERIAFARTIQKAIGLLGKGAYESCLLMVVDSLIDDSFLEQQLIDNSLKTNENPVGYVPGEGAAIILLSRSKLIPSDLAVGIEIAMDNSPVDYLESDDGDFVRDDTVWQGEKLFNVLKSLYSLEYERQPFPQMVVDLNGETQRAIEHGNVLVKLKIALPDAVLFNPIIPALSFAEVGAMFGPLALAHCLTSVHRDYAENNAFILCLSEHSGKRAAIRLTFSLRDQD